VESEIAPVVKDQLSIDRNIPGPHICVRFAMRSCRSRVVWIGWAAWSESRPERCYTEKGGSNEKKNKQEFIYNFKILKKLIRNLGGYRI
jgi:hypothetical protein